MWILLFLLIVGLLIFAPIVLGVALAGLAMVAIPFLVFFAIWAAVIYVFIEILPNLILLGVVVGFVLGIIGARSLVKKVTAPARAHGISN